MGSSSRGSSVSTIHRGGTSDNSTVDERVAELRGDLLRAAASLWEDVLARPPPTNPLQLWKEHLVLWERLAEINEKQSVLAAAQPLPHHLVDDQHSTPTEEHMSDLIAWARHEGAQINGVTLARTESSGWGLVTTEAVPSDSVVIRVPRRACLSLDRARQAPRLRELFRRDEIVRGMSNVGLAVALAAERVTLHESSFRSYVRALPVAHATPLYFTARQLQSLRPSPAFEESVHFIRSVIRQFIYFLMQVAKKTDFEVAKKARPLVPLEVPAWHATPFTLTNFTWELYRWAVSSVATRINFIPARSAPAEEQHGEPATMVAALIPLLDMANHEWDLSGAEQRAVVVFDAREDVATIQVSRNYSAGQPLCIHYGARTNAAFLVHNGFVPPPVNPFDSYSLRLGTAGAEGGALKLVNRLRDRGILSALGASPSGAVPAFVSFDIVEPEEKDGLPYSPVLEQFVECYVGGDRTKSLNFLLARIRLLLKAYELPIPPTLEAETECCTPVGEHGTPAEWLNSMLERLKTGEQRLLRGAERFLAQQLTIASP